TGALLSVSESTFDSLKSMVGLRLAYPLQLDSGRKLVPEARVAWVHEFMDDQASFFASVQGQARPPSRVLGEEYSRDTLAVGVGVNLPLSDTAAVFVDYDAGLNNDITTHTVSAGLRVTW
ncbi:MAG: autotransporter outer membrane beta-barrel domain-containing protein, partial [Aquincola sp.]|nr:autotransporter outer membrane beta-barrel domain-containing protein [Aquincola sp.]